MSTRLNRPTRGTMTTMNGRLGKIPKETIHLDQSLMQDLSPISSGLSRASCYLRLLCFSVCRSNDSMLESRHHHDKLQFTLLLHCRMWPLGCSSPLDFIYQIALNITTIALILGVAYWNLCGEMPTSNLDLNISLIKQHAAILLTKVQHCICRVEVANDFTTKTLALIQTFIEGGHSPASWPVSVDVECLGPFVEAFVALSFGILLLQFYQRWSRFAIFLLASVHIFLSSSYAQLYLSPRPSISSIDPGYAMLDEELVVGIEGVHLQAGGSIAWIPSWCAESTYASSSFVGDCTKQFESTYRMGVVHVTFKLLDTFIPCYKAPSNPLRAQDFHCFDAQRIRVKDRESIPGLPKQLSPAPNEPLSTPPTDPPLAAPIQPVSAGPMQPTSVAPMKPISAAPIQPVSASPVEHLTVEVAADGDLESSPTKA
ncbi:hypothetical protein AC1031_010606 [Aphanomyces cochlioides]|nr:hypothetical protein AC1031_010606 [Aphanomyces cochlioides]